MSKIKFTKFIIKRYRSLLDVQIKINDQSPVVVCGENNIGKTNLLRALNVFFNHIFDNDLYKASDDIPHHIYYGSKGAGSKTELTGYFEIDDIEKQIKVVFDNSGDTSYLVSGKKSTVEEVKEILVKFKFLYLESHNINLPQLISVILENEGLLPLDNKRKKQSEPLKKLEQFIKLSQTAIADIEKDINSYFRELTDFESILNGKEIKINFAEFDKLRDVVKTMTSITLNDGNEHCIASKGSGAQRAVFLSLMQFISQNSKKNIIWGIDEPESFLQPKLQKKVFKVLSEVSTAKKQPVILTTHSQHFVDLNNLKNTHIFEGKTSQKRYARKPNEVFNEIETKSVEVKSDYEKATLIKKHLGISNNDGWEIFPYNVIVEGEEDKKYISSFIGALGLPVPNIVFSGGASKIGGYLQYYNIVAQDLNYKPKFICIFDNDEEGRDQSRRVKPSSYSYIEVQILDLPRYDGVVYTDKNKGDWEIEDFLPPDTILVNINKILKKNHYKIITKLQIKNRKELAHINKQILNYAEECINQNNADKEPFKINNMGRKKELCINLCENLDFSKIKKELNEKQKKFIKKIANND